MPAEKYLKCDCSRCGGRIEFPPDGVGTTVACPHCGLETELTIETDSTDSDDSARGKKWIVAGIVILVIGVVGSIGALVIATNLSKKTKLLSSQNTPVARNAAAKSATPKPAAEPSEVINNFAAFPATIEKKRNSSLIYAVGTLRNETDKQRFGVSVEVDLLDRDGTKIGTAKDYKDLIEPHAEWKFRAPVLVANGVTSARVSAVHEK